MVMMRAREKRRKLARLKKSTCSLWNTPPMNKTEAKPLSLETLQKAYDMAVKGAVSEPAVITRVLNRDRYRKESKAILDKFHPGETEGGCEQK